MVIPAEFRNAMIEHARAGFPNEACGLLAAKDGRVVRFYPLTNAEESPVTYRLESHEQLRAINEIDDNDWEQAAIFHSHTRTPAYPSATDVELAFFPDTLYIIVSLAYEPDPHVRAFRIVDGVISEEPLIFED